MLEYDRTQGYKDISQGINNNKTITSKECDICHYWYFLDENVESYVCNDLMQKAVNFNDIVIFSAKGNNYRTHFRARMMQLA